MPISLDLDYILIFQRLNILAHVLTAFFFKLFLQLNKDVEIIWSHEQRSKDEECFIVEHVKKIPRKIVSKPVENVKPIKMESTTNAVTSEPIVKVSDLVMEFSSPLDTKKPRVPLSPRVKRKQPAAPEILVSDVINLTTDEWNQSSNSKSVKLEPISTRKFYLEETKISVHNNVSTATSHTKPVASQASQASKAPAKKSTTKRKASSKAVSKSDEELDALCDYDYVPEEPKVKQKREPRKAVAARKNKLSSPAYTARSPFKRDGPKQGRKLFNKDDIIDVEMVEEEKPKQKNMPANDELTGESFRGSFCATAKNQNNRVLENLKHINKKIGERKKVSFSYRESKKDNNEQKADSTVGPNVREFFIGRNIV